MRLLSKFLMLKQQGGETATTYINHFQYTLNQARVVENKCDDEMWLVDLFLGGLQANDQRYAAQIVQSQANRRWEENLEGHQVWLTNIQATFQQIDENLPHHKQAHAGAIVC